MDNNQFLKKTILMAEFLSRTSPKQMISVKSVDSLHLYCSPYLLELMGATTKEMDKKAVWFPLYENNKEIEQIIREEDLLIIQAREPKMVLKINKFTTRITPYICNKSPIINPETNDVVGILFQGFTIGNANLHHAILSLLSNNTKKYHNKLPQKLTKREKQVIFLFMANLSSQEIASLLSSIEKKEISKTAVDSLFNDQLYPKFEAHSRIDLYKKLHALGFENKIPEAMLKSTSLFLHKTDVY
ncbi:MAG: hypothetical protein Q8L78_07090 [Coxiellaceae bacterium]|nr:hypothetical protein [Coxiellaceae bacterium]